MTIEPGVSVEQLLHALQRKNIPLPYEMGTFIALECCERVVGNNALVSQSDVFVSDDGDVMVDAAARAGSEEDACRALVEMLGELLVRSAPGVPPMLLTLVEQGPSDGEWGLKRLRDDLEASLVPLNRAATRRVLARLLREIRRDRASLRAEGKPAQRDLNRDIDDVLGGTPDLASDTEPGQLPAPTPGPDADAGTDEDEDDDEATIPRVALDSPHAGHPEDEALVDDLAGALEPEPEPEPEPSSPGQTEAEPARASPRSPQLELRPSDVRGGGVRDLEQLDDGGRSRVGLAIGASLLLLSALMVGAYVGLGRDGVRRILGMEVETPAAASAEPATPAPPTPPPRPAKRYGDLEVTSTPARAQVLLYVGTAPVEITGLPVGVAHELVAMADGRQPARAVVPENATWNEKGDELRYDLSIELPAGDGEELGATKLPRDMGGPTGATGTVRVETRPSGARIYQLVGFTPDVRVENLAVDEQVELLVYLKGHALERVTVGTDRFLETDGKLRASIDVQLAEKK